MLLSEFNRILGNQTATIAADGTTVSNLMQKGRRTWPDEMRKLLRHIMDFYVATNYTMNWDGTTTGQYNHLTEAQFNKLMSRIKKYAS